MNDTPLPHPRELRVPAEHKPGNGKSGIQREKPDASREQLIFIADVFHELFDLLEQYAPVWYTEEQHNRAVAALCIMRSALKKYRT
jgi:hypothetical protein